jgi:hypothetical protein
MKLIYSCLSFLFQGFHARHQDRPDPTPIRRGPPDSTPRPVHVSVMNKSWHWPLLKQESAVSYLKLVRKHFKPSVHLGWTVARSLQREGVNLRYLCHMNGISKNYEWIIITKSRKIMSGLSQNYECIHKLMSGIMILQNYEWFNNTRFITNLWIITNLCVVCHKIIRGILQNHYS